MRLFVPGMSRIHPGRKATRQAVLFLLLVGVLSSSWRSAADMDVSGEGEISNGAASREHRALKSKRELTWSPPPSPYPDPAFYTALTKKCYASDYSDSKVWHGIEDLDVHNGTYRILQSGCYYLKENILFEPNGRCCDYWPKFDTSSPDVYPMGPFTLGFFAAISIEATDVLLDLNGKKIECSMEFTFKQRFFNVIQFASRVFEAHDGMPSLNLQNGEKLVIQGLSKADLAKLQPDIRGERAEDPRSLSDDEKLCPRRNNFYNVPNKVPERIVVRNGVLGASSHNSIHGSGGPANIVVEDLICRDFEVAGIQFNGAKNLTIRRVQVGPNIRPFVLGTFSSTRFIGFWFAFFWRRFWTEDEKDVLIRNNYITFHDRPGKPVRIFDVFARQFIAEQVYTEATINETITPRPPFSIDRFPGDEISELFQEAERILENKTRKADFYRIMNESDQAWGNPTRYPDGGVMYGINLHRRRKGVHKAGEEDWNFYGPDEDSTINARIYNVSIRDLRNSPMQVPAVRHSQGGILNGPTGEVFRLSEMAYYEGEYSLRAPAVYKGNLQSDAMFAFYKVAHDFWQYSFWGIKPDQGLYDDLRVTCGNNPFIDAASNISCPPHLPQTPQGPRKCDDPANLHKRFFGGIRLSPEIFKWATVGLPEGVKSILTYNTDPATRKKTNHGIACGGDTMFHSVKGLIPLKIDFASDVIVDGLTITNVTNIADRNKWFCDHQWNFPDSNQVGPMTEKDYKGGDVKAAVVTKSFNTTLRNIRVDYVESEEGKAIGFDLIGDENGRAKFRKSFVPQVAMSNVALGSRVRAGQPGFVSPMIADVTALNLGGFLSNEAANLQNNWKPAKSTITLFGEEYGLSEIPGPISSGEAADILSSVYIDPDTLKYEAVEYFIARFGIPKDLGNKAVLKGESSATSYYVQTLCFFNSSCQGPWTSSEVQDVYYALPIDPSWIIKGSYAGDTGGLKFSAGYEVRVGVYVINQFTEYPLVIRYFSFAPELTLVKGISLPLQKGIDYEVYNARLGHGVATGNIVYSKTSSGIRQQASLQLNFDDIVKNFQTILYSDGRKVPSFLDPTDLVMSFDTKADGPFNDFDPLDQEVTPLTRTYYLKHEGGIKDLKRWLKEDDSAIFKRRDDFIQFLTDKFGVKFNFPLPLESKWLENEFLGISPYSESHNTDLRLQTGVGLDNEPDLYNFTRVIEVGFKFDGPNGVIKQGVYIFENCTSDGSIYGYDFDLPCACLASNPEITFATSIPSKVNELNQAFIYENVALRKYPSCSGIYQAVSIQPPKDQNTIHLGYRIAGSFKFYGTGCALAMTDGYTMHGYPPNPYAYTS